MENSSRIVPVVATVSGSALVPMVVGHVVGAGTVNPFVDPISYYAFVPWGYEAVATGAILLAVCGVVLAHRLARLGVPRASLGAVMLLSFAAAMLLVAVFPTDPPGALHTSAGAVLHRVGAGWAFAILPVLGLTVIRGTGTDRGTRVVVRTAVVTAVAVAGFFAVHVPLALTGGHIPAFGLIERAGFALMVAYLIALAVALQAAPVGARGGARAAAPVPSRVRVSPSRVAVGGAVRAEAV